MDVICIGFYTNFNVSFFRERPLTTIEEVPESEEVSTQSEFMLAATPNVIQKVVSVLCGSILTRYSQPKKLTSN